jgi:FecR protein
MQIKNTAPPIIFAMVFAFQAQALAQDPKIGSAEQAQNKVEGIIGGQSEPVSKGSALYSNETVRTGENGVADLVFLDSTNLTVGPISEVLLDKFVYDPNGSSGVVVLQATKGAFRFVTGSQDKRAYQVQTPFGSLGVRGTIVEMMLVPCVPGAPPTTCGATLRLVYGAATFTTATETIDLATGTTLSVNGSGQSSLSSGSGSILPGVMAALGAADVTGSLGSSGAGGGGGGTGGTGTGNTQTSIGGSLGLTLVNRPAATTPSTILPPLTTITAATAATAAIITTSSSPMQPPP